MTWFEQFKIEKCNKDANCQPWKAEHCVSCSLEWALEKADKLDDAILNLLKSADVSWEEHDLGHDWSDAVNKARQAHKDYRGE